MKKRTLDIGKLVEQARQSANMAHPDGGSAKMAQVESDAPLHADLACRATRDELLEHLRECPVMTKACRAVGVRYRDLQAHRKVDPDFDAEIEDARLEGWERVEEAAFDDALTGGWRSGRMREFLLKGRKRHVYGDRLDVTQSHRHTVTINLIPPGECPPPALGGPQAASELPSGRVTHPDDQDATQRLPGTKNEVLDAEVVDE